MGVMGTRVQRAKFAEHDKEIQELKAVIVDLVQRVKALEKPKRRKKDEA